MTVTQLSDFLPAIRAEPDNDEPRLVAADWLEDQGDEESLTRAELIRLQCGDITDATIQRARELLTIIPASQFGLPDLNNEQKIREAYICRGFVKHIAGYSTPLLRAIREGVHLRNPLDSIQIQASRTSLPKIQSLLNRTDILEHIERVKFTLEDALFVAEGNQNFGAANVVQTGYHYRELDNDYLRLYAPLFQLSHPPRVIELPMREMIMQEVLCSALPDLTHTATTQVVAVIHGQNSRSANEFWADKRGNPHFAHLQYEQICAIWNTFLTPCETRIHNHLTYRVERTERSGVHMDW